MASSHFEEEAFGPAGMAVCEKVAAQVQHSLQTTPQKALGVVEETLRSLRGLHRSPAPPARDVA